MPFLGKAGQLAETAPFAIRASDVVGAYCWPLWPNAQSVPGQEAVPPEESTKEGHLCGFVCE
jgi:hypothetical protein